MWSWLALLREKQLFRGLLCHITSVAVRMGKSSLTDAVVTNFARRDAPTTAQRSNTASRPARRWRTARPVLVADEREVMWPSAARSRGISRKKTGGRHIRREDCGKLHEGGGCGMDSLEGYCTE